MSGFTAIKFSLRVVLVGMVLFTHAVCASEGDRQIDGTRYVPFETCVTCRALQDAIDGTSDTELERGKFKTGFAGPIDGPEIIGESLESKPGIAGNSGDRVFTLAQVENSEESDEVSAGDQKRWFRGDPEFGFELGFFTFWGTDILLTYRVKESPWLVGYRYASWTETIGSFYDNEVEHERAGLHGRYLFKPEGPGTFYLAASWLEQTRKLTCEISGDSDSDSVTGPLFGAGYIWRRDKLIKINFGILLSPNEDLENDADGCSKETTAADINFTIGFTI